MRPRNTGWGSSNEYPAKPAKPSPNFVFQSMFTSQNDGGNIRYLRPGDTAHRAVRHCRECPHSRRLILPVSRTRGTPAGMQQLSRIRDSHACILIRKREGFVTTGFNDPMHGTPGRKGFNPDVPPTSDIRPRLQSVLWQRR